MLQDSQLKSTLSDFNINIRKPSYICEYIATGLILCYIIYINYILCEYIKHIIMYVCINYMYNFFDEVVCTQNTYHISPTHSL